MPAGHLPAPMRDGAAFEVRRTVRGIGDLFGREAPRAGDAGAVFLDTETTGLAGGAGTTPFLIGLAYLDGPQVVIEQYFLRHLSGEAAMLAALRARLEDAERLVTFNGRRFDWPILEARFVLSRMPMDPPPIHDDLMRVARRLWYRPLGTYRLSAVERLGLGIDRGDDIDSAEIPGLYVQYLHTGDLGLLEPVFEHNHHDICSLIHLRRRTRRWIEDGEDPPPPVDWEGLGVLRLQAANEAGAEDALRRALSVEDDPAVRWRTAQRLARLFRRAARWEELAALWERDLGGGGAWRVRTLVEAAKVHRYRLRQPNRALALLEEASGIAEWLLWREDPAAPALHAEVQGRLARLGR